MYLRLEIIAVQPGPAGHVQLWGQHANLTVTVTNAVTVTVTAGLAWFYQLNQTVAVAVTASSKEQK